MSNTNPRNRKAANTVTGRQAAEILGIAYTTFRRRAMAAGISPVTVTPSAGYWTRSSINKLRTPANRRINANGARTGRTQSASMSPGNF